MRTVLKKYVANGKINNDLTPVSATEYYPTPSNKHLHMIGCKPTWIIPISVTYRTTITDDVDISANVTGVDDRHIGSYITVLSMANHSLRQQVKGSFTT